MNFIREIGREEMYIKYVHQLVNVGKSTTFVSSDAHRLLGPLAISKLCGGCTYSQAAL